MATIASSDVRALVGISTGNREHRRQQDARAPTASDGRRDRRASTACNARPAPSAPFDVPVALSTAKSRVRSIADR